MSNLCNLFFQNNYGGWAVKGGRIDFCSFLSGKDVLVYSDHDTESKWSGFIFKRGKITASLGMKQVSR